MEKEFKHYVSHEGMGAAFYAVIGITFAIGAVIGVVLTFICK